MAQGTQEEPSLQNGANTSEETPAPPPPSKSRSKKLSQRPGTGTSRTSAFLPDWPPPQFALNVSPVAGFRYQYDPTSKDSTTLMEIGGMLGISGIPIYDANPGIYIEPYAGYAIGQAIYAPTTGSTQTGTFHRPWAGVRIPLLIRFYKQTLGIKYGQIQGEIVSTRRSLGVESDNAFLIVPFFSAHYTLSYEKTAAQSLDTMLTETYDQWYHGRAFTRFLHAYIDIGPGITFQKTYREPNTTAISVEGNSTTTYARGIGGFDLISNFLGLEAQAKYVLSSKIDGTITYDTARSPVEDLGAAERKLGLPDDSLYASIFFGLKNVFGNMGVGWRYTMDVSNATERNGKRDTQTTQGIGISYSMRM